MFQCQICKIEDSNLGFLKSLRNVFVSKCYVLTYIFSKNPVYMDPFLMIQMITNEYTVKMAELNTLFYKWIIKIEIQ